MSNIRFARLGFRNKLSHYTDERDAIERRKDLLLNVIDYETDLNHLLKNTDSHDKTRKGTWNFGDVVPEDGLISARLAKQTEDVTHLPDDEKEGFVAHRYPDSEISFFTIDLYESVMAYEYVGGIGRKAPYRILRDAFNSFYQGEEELTASIIDDKQEIKKELEKISFVEEIQFRNLQPPNPDHTDTSKPMDDFLEESKVNRLHMRAVSDQRRNNPEGVDIDGSPLLYGGLNLAQEGYGSATVEGKTDGGEPIEVKTGQIPVKAEAELGEDDSVNRKRLLEEIREMIEELDE